MRIGESTERALVFPARVRWLAVAAGCLSGLSGSLVYGIEFAIAPLILVLGTLLQPYSPRPGRYLTRVAAFFGSFFVGVLLAPISVSLIRVLGLHLDSSSLTLFCLSLTSVLVVSWLDIELIAEAVRAGH